jgi:cholesterol oxidase
MQNQFDYIVIGSGFGGSVSTLRLAEKGYKVAVIEQGKRFADADYPTTNWNIKKYLWLPMIRCFGIQKLTFFKKVFILSGVGVGGGSLVYANTLFKPNDKFFNNGNWAKYKDWKSTLESYYELAKKMLGAVANPYTAIEDDTLKALAQDLNRLHTFQNVDVGVNFNPINNFDPYFKGLGPKRNPCLRCAGCMVGCRHNAKNTLDKNYLYLAEKHFGASIIAETKVIKIQYSDNLYTITTQKSTPFFNKKTTRFTCKGLVLSAGVLGTLDLLLNQKYTTKTLPNLSQTIGNNLRTNSESICGIVSEDVKLNNNIAITSVFSPDDATQIEVCKYPTGSSLMLRMAAPAVGPGSGVVRLGKMFGAIFTHPIQFLKILFKKDLANNTIIFLVMQTLDNAFAMKLKKGLFGGMKIEDSKDNVPVPAYIEVGQKAMYAYAKKINGVAQNSITEIAFNMATTAHIMGGVPMGSNASEGVIDDNFKVHNYPDFFVLDGSILQFNPGVNPSLSITAIAEYAMNNVPKKTGFIGKNLDEMMLELSNY